MADTFKKVTNNEMYDKIMKVHEDVLLIKQQVNFTNGNVRLHRKWLWAMSGAFCSGFICLVGFMLRLHYG